MPIDIPINIRLSEIVAIDDNNVPVHPNIDVTKVIGKDVEPMFVNLEVLRSYDRTENKRIYTDQAIRDIAELLPGVQGFLGHPDPTKTSFEFRIPQSIYVGSKVVEEAGQIKTLAKTYVFPESGLRQWIPASLATGNPITVSIYGKGDVTRAPDGTITVHRVNQLDSVDWANPGTQGGARSSVLSIVSEMIDEGGNNPMPERQQIVAGVTLQEIRSFNPTVVTEAVRGVTLAELTAANPQLVQEIQNAARISEIALTVDGSQRNVAIADVQGLIDTKVAEIAAIKTEHEMEGHLAEMIAAEIPEEHRERVTKRISIKGQSKEQITQAVKNEAAYLAEIAGTTAPNNPPIGGKPRVDTGDDNIRAGLRKRFGIQEPKK